MNETTLAAFLSEIGRSDDCWEWAGAKWNTGYGAFYAVRPRVWTNRRYAHRESYEHYVGPIPAGLTIDHLCRNRACVNPDHLEPVTRGENSLRGETFVAANRAKLACPRGHPYAADNVRSYRARRNCRTCERERTQRRAALRRAA